MVFHRIKSIQACFFGVVLALSTTWPELAYAFDFGLSDIGTNLGDIARSIAKSIEEIPWLVSSLAYLIGLGLGVWGILKIKDHVENPQQTRLSEGVIRLIAGGALFSLEILFEAMKASIGGAELDLGSISIIGAASAGISAISNLAPTQTANQVMSAIINSFEDIPGLISAGAYLAAIILGIWGVLNIKDNIESGQSNPPLREGIARLGIGGALFALPTVFEAMRNSIQNRDALDAAGDAVGELLGIGSLVLGGNGLSCDADSLIAGGGPIAGGIAGGLGMETSNTLGTVMCNSIINTAALPAFLYSVSYLLGMVLGLWGIFKLRDYVINPQQTQAWDFVSRFAAAGSFFALPMIIRAVSNSLGASALVPHSPGTVQNPENLSEDGEGLDVMLVNLMNDVSGPATVLVNWFGYVAGSILIFIGVSRLLKSSQEGARGPGGIGTIMTFVVGGALVSFAPMVSAIGSSLFGGDGIQTKTYVVLTETTSAAMSPDAQAHVKIVISSVLTFMMIVGLVSIMRGVFLVREVAEGSQQASLMAAMSHIVGGALAVNLGTFMTSVQSTLGLGDLGVGFEAGGGGGVIGALGSLFGG